MKTLLICSLFLVASLSPALAQDDDLAALVDGLDEETTEYVKAGFKTTRVINSQSFENVAGGVLDIKISHRFGFLSGGAYELFGLDQATIRIGADYGINDRFMIGFGRSSFEKTYDGFFKYKLIRQSTGKAGVPLSLLWYSSVALKTLKETNPNESDYFSSRLYYAHQLIIGRKFSEGFSLQFMPTLVHRNLVETTAEQNDVLAVGMAARQKITKRIAINTEYYYVLPEQLANDYRNSLSIGFDIETGGHVFQLHFTNSTSMIEKGFVTENTGDWLNGDVHFGFNVSRVFTVVNRMKKAERE